jgi:4-amino-4-deoxy-L-arabinose transferase-like glycosyltransferase
VLRLLLRHRRFFLGTFLAGLVLRTCFFVFFPAVTDDSRVYSEIATNWVQHGTYGTDQAEQIVPTDERLPGYPAFLAVVFFLFGPASFRAVMVVQILLDLATCFIAAALAQKLVSDRAAKFTFLLAALCPFLANYAAAVLTETLEIFFTVVALNCAAAGLKRLDQGEFHVRAWAASGLAVAACILLRPDGGLLLASLSLYLLFFTIKAWRRNTRLAPAVKAGLLLILCALFPLAPWTIRNLRTLHEFQPLAPRYATANDELVDLGFNRWVGTWIADYASVEEIYWNVPGENIDPDKLPARAFDSLPQQETTLALLTDYNESHQITSELDKRFDSLAVERIRERPLRYYFVLPVLRIADMWLRPRTELLPSDVRWWEFNDDIKGSILAVTVGLLNLAFLTTACLAVVQRPSRIAYLGMLLGFVLLRSAFLGTLENPETRYTLECYPVIIFLAAKFLTDRTSGNASSETC